MDELNTKAINSTDLSFNFAPYDLYCTLSGNREGNGGNEEEEEERESDSVSVASTPSSSRPPLQEIHN